MQLGDETTPMAASTSSGGGQLLDEHRRVEQGPHEAKESTAPPAVA